MSDNPAKGESWRLCPVREDRDSRQLVPKLWQHNLPVRLQAQISALPNAVARSAAPDATVLTEKIVKHPFNYLSSFGFERHTGKFRANAVTHEMVW